MNQKIDFCSGYEGLRIAYASMGEGPPLVKAANWLTHLEFDSQSPVWRHWWMELSESHRFVRYDERGCGLSDWSPETLSVDAWVGDLEAVVDSLGLEQFALLGMWKGGSIAIEYAARHPERVSRLILYATYARGPATLGAQRRDEVTALATLIRNGWGLNNPAYRQIFTSLFIPGANSEQMDWFNELQRISSSPEHTARCEVASSNIDVLHRVSQVQVPTLVLHSKGDSFIPFDDGKQIAAMIPNAQFVALDSNNHILLEDEPAWEDFLSEVRGFLGMCQSGMPTSAVSEVTRAGPDGLTPREVEVLQLMAEGRSNQVIANTLFISVNTVTNHVKNILGKTGSTNRTEAAAYAIVRGLTKPEA